RKANIAPFFIAGKKAKIGVLSPEAEQTVKAIDAIKEKGYAPTLYMVSHESLEHVWKRYKELSFSFETKAGSLDIASDDILDIIKNVKSTDDVKKMVSEVLGMKKSFRVSRILEIVLAGALATDASDIHLEPEEGYVRLRYRLDGVLTDILKFDLETYGLMLSRIKLLSGLKLNVSG